MERISTRFKGRIRKDNNVMILVSIIGDSISTYEHYNPPDYAVFYDKEKQALNGMTSVYDTWWAKVNQALHANLCVNNSYSGSKVTGNSFPAGSSIERISNLATAECTPDIILLYIGFNDFGNGIKISRQKSGLFRKADLSYFEEAYKLMVDRIKKLYPKAIVICGTLLRSKLKHDPNWEFPENYAGIPFENYNNAIRNIAKKEKVYLADVSTYEGRYETLDGSHPTAKGHKTIADAWIKSLAESGIFEAL